MAGSFAMGDRDAIPGMPSYSTMTLIWSLGCITRLSPEESSLVTD